MKMILTRRLRKFIDVSTAAWLLTHFVHFAEIAFCPYWGVCLGLSMLALGWWTLRLYRAEG